MYYDLVLNLYSIIIFHLDLVSHQFFYFLLSIQFYYFTHIIPVSYIILIIIEMLCLSIYKAA